MFTDRLDADVAIMATNGSGRVTSRGVVLGHMTRDLVVVRHTSGRRAGRTSVLHVDHLRFA